MSLSDRVEKSFRVFDPIKQILLIIKNMHRVRDLWCFVVVFTHILPTSSKIISKVAVRDICSLWVNIWQICNKNKPNLNKKLPCVITPYITHKRMTINRPTRNNEVSYSLRIGEISISGTMIDVNRHCIILDISEQYTWIYQMNTIVI